MMLSKPYSYFSLPRKASLRFSLGLLLAASTLAGQAEDWPRWRGPNLDGISTEKGWSITWPKEGPKPLWTSKVGTGFSSVAVSDGRVYTLGNNGNKDTLFCFDANSGVQQWAHTYPSDLQPKYYDGGPSATPTVDGSRVFSLSKKGEVFCLDAKTGKVVWSKNLAQEAGAKMPTWGFAGSPLAQGRLLVLNIGSYGTAVDKETGKIVWQSGTGPAGYATPLPFKIGDQRGLATFAADALIAVETATGKKLWSVPWVTDYDVNAADPIFQGDKVFISSGYGSGGAVFQITGNRGKLVWKNEEMHNHFNPCVLVDGHLYGISGDAGGRADLRCVDFNTGAVKWKEKAPAYGSLMAADGKLIVLGEKGELIVAEATPTAFKPLARAQVIGGRCWTTPVLANGKVYARNSRGDLVCLDVSGK